MGRRYRRRGAAGPRARSRYLAENREAAQQFKWRGDRRVVESPAADDLGAPCRRKQDHRHRRRPRTDRRRRQCRRRRAARLAPRAVRRSGAVAEAWPGRARDRKRPGGQDRSRLAPRFDGIETRLWVPDLTRLLNADRSTSLENALARRAILPYRLALAPRPRRSSRLPKPRPGPSIEYRRWSADSAGAPFRSPSRCPAPAH